MQIQEELEERPERKLSAERKDLKGSRPWTNEDSVCVDRRRKSSLKKKKKDRK